MKTEDVVVGNAYYTLFGKVWERVVVVREESISSPAFHKRTFASSSAHKPIARFVVRLASGLQLPKARTAAALYLHPPLFTCNCDSCYAARCKEAPIVHNLTVCDLRPKELE